VIGSIVLAACDQLATARQNDQPVPVIEVGGFCLKDATLDDLKRQSADRLRALVRHYSACTFETPKADRVSEELVLRGDPQGEFDTALRLLTKPSGDKQRALQLMRLSSRHGYRRADQALAHMERGEIP
jgi:hypothetical protein